LLVLQQLVTRSHLSIEKFGFNFFTSKNWDPVAGDFGALPFIYGTLVSSFLALLMAVPLGVGTAIFLTDMCPRALRGVIAWLVELLAAIPSVIYGLWGMYVLIPLLRSSILPVLAKTFKFLDDPALPFKSVGLGGFFSGPIYGVGMLPAAIIMAIMVVPFISSITREVIKTVPIAQREAALALGATRWEMLRVGVLRNARTGIFGGIILALGRALGETIAVTMLIGNRPEIAKSLFAPGYTLASVIANEFSEATTDIYLSALIEIGLALLLVTLVVNVFAQLLIWSITGGVKAGSNA
jgi:phosphate transport system permease protein